MQRCPTMWVCVNVCDLETLTVRHSMPNLGWVPQENKHLTSWLHLSWSFTYRNSCLRQRIISSQIPQANYTYSYKQIFYVAFFIVFHLGAILLTVFTSPASLSLHSFPSSGPLWPVLLVVVHTVHIAAYIFSTKKFLNIIDIQMAQAESFVPILWRLWFEYELMH